MSTHTKNGNESRAARSVLTRRERSLLRHPVKWATRAGVQYNTLWKVLTKQPIDPEDNRSGPSIVLCAKLAKAAGVTLGTFYRRLVNGEYVRQ